MNTNDYNKGPLVPAPSSAAEHPQPRHGLPVESGEVLDKAHDVTTGERCCTEDHARILFCLDHECCHDQCPNVPHLDFALIPIERVVKLPRIVPHLWTGPDDVAHGFPPGCSYCGESDPAQYGKPCPERTCNTWYEILGVPEDAELNQINDAYHELASEWNPARLQHPDDKVFDAGYSATQMMWLNAAYAVLNDPARRQQYDAELLQQHLNEPEWWTSKGNMLDAQGQHLDALECHEKALAINAECASAWINKGLCLDELGRLGAAVECYDKAIDVDRTNYVPLVRKGDILDRLELHGEAIHCFDAALKLRADLISAWKGKGLALDHLGRYEDAIACYDEVLKIDRTSWTEYGRASAYSDAWNSKGVTFSRARRFQDAIECYNRAISFDPKYANSWYNKGIALMKTGHIDDAIGCYDKAIELWPGHAGSWHNKGRCLRDLRRMEEAITCHEKALACDPPEILAWFSKAQAMEDLGRLNEAVRSYEKYLSVAPVDAHHRANIEHGRARLADLKSRIARNRTMKDERPDYWAEPPSAEEAVLRGIKGNFRREMVAKSLSTEGLPAIPEAWQAHLISERLKEVLTSMAGPQARGGEDLPDLVQGEIEIARLTFVNSVHGEVTSLRARRDPKDVSILLSMVDEYGTEYQLPVQKVSASLTAEEVLVMFRDAEPSPTDTSCQIGFNSWFYPDLDAVAVEMGMKPAKW
jgi:tetratricopeptide (TPR) repeat protein